MYKNEGNSDLDLLIEMLVILYGFTNEYTITTKLNEKYDHIRNGQIENLLEQLNFEEK